MANQRNDRRAAKRRADARDLPGGFEAGEYGWKRRRRRTSRRDFNASARVCRQVRERLELVFFGEIAEPILQGLELIEVVELVPGSLTIWVSQRDGFEAKALSDSLERARGYLRGEVADAIHRRRVPELRFIVVE